MTAKTRRLGLRGLLLIAAVVLAAATLHGRLPGPASLLATLRAADPRWVTVAVAAGLLSQVCFAEQQRRLLAAFAVRLPAVSAVALTFTRSAISMAVPAGSAVSAAYAFRVFRRAGAEPAVAAGVTVLSGVVSTVGLALLYGLGWSVAVTSAVVAGLVLLVVGGRRLFLRLAGSVPGPAGLRRRVSGAPPGRSGRSQGHAGGFAGRASGFAGRAGSFAGRAGGFAGHSGRSDHFGRFPGRSGRVSRIGEAVRGLPARAAPVLRDARAVPARDWAAILLAAVANWLLDICCLLAAAMAVQAPVSGARLALIYLAVQVVRQIPVTPGGLGLIETSMLAGLVAAGSTEATAAAVVLIYRLISFWLVLPLGLAGHVALRPPAAPPRRGRGARDLVMGGDGLPPDVRAAVRRAAFRWAVPQRAVCRWAVSRWAVSRWAGCRCVGCRRAGFPCAGFPRTGLPRTGFLGTGFPQPSASRTGFRSAGSGLGGLRSEAVEEVAAGRAGAVVQQRIEQEHAAQRACAGG